MAAAAPPLSSSSSTAAQGPESRPVIPHLRMLNGERAPKPPEVFPAGSGADRRPCAGERHDRLPIDEPQATTTATPTSGSSRTPTARRCGVLSRAGRRRRGGSGGVTVGVPGERAMLAKGYIDSETTAAAFVPTAPSPPGDRGCSPRRRSPSSSPGAPEDPSSARAGIGPAGRTCSRTPPEGGAVAVIGFPDQAGPQRARLHGRRDAARAVDVSRGCGKFSRDSPAHRPGAPRTARGRWRLLPAQRPRSRSSTGFVEQFLGGDMA